MKLVTSLLKPLAGEFKLLAVRIDPEISFTKDFVGTYRMQTKDFVGTYAAHDQEEGVCL